MVKKIRIVDVPPGEAPLEIRQAWVGLELPLSDIHGLSEELQDIFNKEFPSRGVLGGSGDTENQTGYCVSFEAAMDCLRVKDETAAEWWQTESVCRPGSRLQFAKRVCQLIDQ